MKQVARTKKQLARQIGGLARQARLQLKLTQADVAERVGVVTEVYGRLERGNMMPQVSTLRKVCVTLNLDANEALGLGQDAPRGKLPAPVSNEEKSPALRRIHRLTEQLNAKNRDILGKMAKHMGCAQKVRKARRMEHKKEDADMEVQP